MTGPVIALWIILAGAGSALLGPPKAWAPKDPTARSHFGKPSKVEYRTWTASPARDPKTGDCTVTIFALVTRNKLTRLRVQGEEKLLDWSWSWEAKIPNGYHADGMIVEFVDPVTRETVARHDVSEFCEWMPPRGGSISQGRLIE